MVTDCPCVSPVCQALAATEGNSQTEERKPKEGKGKRQSENGEIF